MPQDPAVEDDVKELIRLVFRFVRNAKGHGPGIEEVRGLLEGGKFGPRHLSALFALAMSGPEAVGELADRMGLSPATVSQLVNELERGGFVDRREDPHDRRRTIVSLAERHRGPIESYARRRLKPLRVTVETLSPAERAHFIKGWRVLVQAQEQAGDDAGDHAEEQGEERAGEQGEEPAGAQAGDAAPGARHLGAPISPGA
jgi:DNA-binding MarR family transcriptional regulator